ncbi:hypothetical protein SLS60_000139 [Paraconiothyrium brasiliense]|uniref:Uncharacterized protein n=1 Tax=Paraconiothyrium brasiliense TaxID=300254 RepID=A0ABR3S5E0_9PLEO
MLAKIAVLIDYYECAEALEPYFHNHDWNLEESNADGLATRETVPKEGHEKVKALAGMVKMPRSFLVKNPDDYDLEGWYELSIPSDDGTPLEAWYIPAKEPESNEFIIFNHALLMCRAAYSGHMGEPWSSIIEPVEAL